MKKYFAFSRVYDGTSPTDFILAMYPATKLRNSSDGWCTPYSVSDSFGVMPISFTLFTTSVASRSMPGNMFAPRICSNDLYRPWPTDCMMLTKHRKYAISSSTTVRRSEIIMRS